MRHAPSTLHLSPAFPLRAPVGAIEWEELPSLAASLAKRLGELAASATNAAAGPAFHQAGRPWDSTRPAVFEASVPSRPFREPLQGLAIREVDEPDIFRHFFGA